MRPVSGNATPQGRARNRRIEILLMPDLQAKRAALNATARDSK
jgi:chemotaxis protein MotB